MQRMPWLAAAFVVATSAVPVAAAPAATRVAVPPPPAYHLARAPQTSMVAGSQVYVVEDRRIPDDEFQYGVFWYVYRNRHWYCARHWNGPFLAIEPRDVPRAIITVPPSRWKHPPEGAPGLATRRAPPAWVAEKERRIHGER
jgi:hypothetical protein